jgi:hypothetical protein
MLFSKLYEGNVGRMGEKRELEKRWSREMIGMRGGV